MSSLCEIVSFIMFIPDSMTTTDEFVYIIIILESILMMRTRVD